MAIFDAITKFSETFISVVHTRLELMTVELEHDLKLWASYAIWTLVGLFCAGMAVVLGTFLLIVLCWESHRLAVVVGLLSFFASAAFIIALLLWRAITCKPALLAATINELKKDELVLHDELGTDR